MKRNLNLCQRLLTRQLKSIFRLCPKIRPPAPAAPTQAETFEESREKSKNKYQLDDDILGSLLKKPKAIHNDIFALPKQQEADPKRIFEIPQAPLPVANVVPEVSILTPTPQDTTNETTSTPWEVVIPEAAPQVSEPTDSHGIPQALLDELRKASQAQQIQNLTIASAYDTSVGDIAPSQEAPQEPKQEDKTSGEAVDVTVAVLDLDTANNSDQAESSLQILLDDGSRQSINLSKAMVGETLLYQQNLRSGQVLEAKGNVVLMGDAHAGSEIKAGGDIVIWGTLSGVAHAGCYGQLQSTIKAFRIEALQLRIGPIIARRPDKLFKKEANLTKNQNQSVMRTETARVVGQEIRVSEDTVRV